ncbi:MAG: endonuclease/exonuclease/phosphatase family protein [Pirellulales bacterium]
MRWHVILALAILAGVWQSARAQEAERSSAEPLRVMTFNIRYNNPGDGENAWPHRKQHAASMIRFHKADVVGLQEALQDQLDDLAAELPQFAWCGVGRDDGKRAGEFSAIGYRTERLELLDSSTFWYSPTPDEPSRAWGEGHFRIATWAHLRDKATGRALYVFNTHFGFADEHRRNAPRLLLERIAKVADDTPVVLTGDFNMTPGSDQYEVITQSSDQPGGLGLRDAMLISQTPHHGPTSTWSGFEKPGTPGRRIDFIFVSPGIEALRHGVLPDTFDGKFPSDHMPVLAEVAVPER